MALSAEQMQKVKVEALGGDEAAKAFNVALNALHTYAQRSGCPAGEDVVAWFSRKGDGYREALAAAIMNSPTPSLRADAPENQPDGGSL